MENKRWDCKTRGACFQWDCACCDRDITTCEESSWAESFRVSKGHTEGGECHEMS